MPATPKSLRQAPTQTFENYVLTRATSPDVGLSKIAYAAMTHVIKGVTDDLVTDFIQLGFKFQFDGVDYEKIVISSNGWLALVDPAAANVAAVTGALLGTEPNNAQIQLTNATQNVLLCPWYDDIRTINEELTDYMPGYTATNKSRLNNGLEIPTNYYNPARGGVKIFYDTKSKSGCRTIVRWNVMSNYTQDSSAIAFEVVLYENGTIEFCYEPINASAPWVGGFVDAATVGIFTPGVNRFRDFGFHLNYGLDTRKQYKYGGAIYSSTYSEVYNKSLNSRQNWPCVGANGAVFTFSPPKNRRKILPRLQQRINDSKIVLPTVARTGDVRRQGSKLISFDDRRTLTYNTNVVVNYPTTLQRFYGGSEPGILGRQDLFSGDFELTGNIVKSSSDEFINSNDISTTSPWNENKLFENDSGALLDPFFSGSDIGLLGEGLQQTLRSKTQIRLSFPVNYDTQMFSISSSIYYYDALNKLWVVPQNSCYYSPKDGNDFVYPGTTKGDIATCADDATYQRIIGDQRGFGPLGNTIASGAVNKTTFYDNTDESINSNYTLENFTKALNKSYSKSVQTNEDYRATVNEVFSLPISQPFLIEKAIFELPLQCGSGWFNDLTQCFQPVYSGTISAGGKGAETANQAFDFAGPALTVALYNQYKIGATTRRDQIMTGTITHTNDNTSSFVLVSPRSDDTMFNQCVLRPQGFLAYGGAPSAIISPTTDSTSSWFTGSVVVKSVAQVSNGAIIKFLRIMSGSNADLNRSGVLDLLNSEYVSLNNETTTHYEQQTKIAYINNFGRGATGFDPSGRSIFGKEFASSQALNEQGKVRNPFYVATGRGGISFNNFSAINNLHPSWAAVIAAGSKFSAHTAISLESCQPSPYLVYPNDTLVLAVSKTRPVVVSSVAGSDTFSGSWGGHDIKLASGTINISLYGSMLRENKEFHDTLNQPLTSLAVHEIYVGNEPVLDQFEGNYREMYVSGSFDDVILGSLVTKGTDANGKAALVQGTRGKVYSKNYARHYTSPGTGLFDTTDSVAYKATPYYEKAGSLRTSQASSISERYWDSLMPGISECLAASNSSIFMTPRVATTIETLFDPTPTTVDPSVGIIVFDGGDGIIVGLTSIMDLGDKNWTWAYPFEPRYSSISRQPSIAKSFFATKFYDPDTSPTVTTLPAPLAIKGFLFGSYGTPFVGVPATTSINTNELTSSVRHGFARLSLTSDTYKFDPTTLYTGSANLSDMSKHLYGFGDINNVMFDNLATTTGIAYPGAGYGRPVRYGNNHLPSFHEKGPYTDNYVTYRYAPIIRGWKYGVISGTPLFSKMYFRQGRFGQFRDILEQRPYTKFYQTNENGPDVENFQIGPTDSVVTVKFVNTQGKLTKPENTWSQNLSLEATSSVPYLDGEARNRLTINMNTLNQNIVSLKTTQFGDVTL